MKKEKVLSETLESYRGKKTYQEVITEGINAFAGKREVPPDISQETDITKKLLFFIFINEVIASSEKYANIRTFVPALIGKTGVGKTSAINKVAEILNLPIKTLLLQTMLPEEVTGIPFAQKEKTYYPLPAWIPDDAIEDTLSPTHNLTVKKPQPLTFREGTFILFLDELDTARQEVLAAVLTLLAEKKIRDTRLFVVPLVAMRPVAEEWQEGETAEALISCLNFLYFPVEIGYEFIAKKYKIGNFAETEVQKVNEQEIIPALNFLPPSVFEYAIAFIDNCMQFGILKKDIRELTKGFLTDVHFNAVWRFIQNKN